MKLIKIFLMWSVILSSSVLWAEVTFNEEQLVLGNSHLTVEIADTPDRWEYGLMNRPSMPDNHGMIFIFPSAEPQNFWMKNTLIPLSIGYFDESGRLFQVLDMEPASPMELQPKIYPSSKPAKYALEVNKGWFMKHKVKLDTKLEFVKSKKKPSS